MKFYTQQHPHYCGIDLHARTMYLCILNQEGVIVLHRNMKTEPEALLKAIAPFREFIAIVVECNFTWYWVADPREGIADNLISTTSSSVGTVLTQNSINDLYPPDLAIARCAARKCSREPRATSP